MPVLSTANVRVGANTPAALYLGGTLLSGAVAGIPKISTVADDFSTNKLATLWPGSSGAITVSDGVASFTVDNNTPASLTTAPDYYDFTGSNVAMKIVAWPDPLAGREIFLSVRPGGTDSASTMVTFGRADNNTPMMTHVRNNWAQIEGYVFRDVGSDLWIRIREAAGTIHFESSADGDAWTSRRTVVHPYTVEQLEASSVHVRALAGVGDSYVFQVASFQR